MSSQSITSSTMSSSVSSSSNSTTLHASRPFQGHEVEEEHIEQVFEDMNINTDTQSERISTSTHNTLHPREELYESKQPTKITKKKKSHSSHTKVQSPATTSSSSSTSITCEKTDPSSTNIIDKKTSFAAQNALKTNSTNNVSSTQVKQEALSEGPLGNIGSFLTENELSSFLEVSGASQSRTACKIALKGREKAVIKQATRDAISDFEKIYKKELEEKSSGDMKNLALMFPEEIPVLTSNAVDLNRALHNPEKRLAIVTELNLSGMNIIDPSLLKFLAFRFPYVQTLNLSHCTGLKFDESCAKAIGEFSKLSSLTLKGAELTDVTFFDFLPKSIEELICPGLTLTHELRNKINSKNDKRHNELDTILIQAFKRFSHLKRFDISGSLVIGGCLFDAPDSLRALKMDLKAPRDSQTLNRCFHAGRMKYLEELDVSCNPSQLQSFATGEFLHHIPVSLLRLNCAGQSFVSNESFAGGLKRLANLTELSVSRTPIGAALQNCGRSLIRLNCSGCALITDDILKNLFQKTPYLMELNCSLTPITGACFQNAPQSLSNLNCSECLHLTDQNLSTGLEHMPHLIALNLSKTRIKGEGLNKALHDLIFLDCSNCQKLIDHNLSGFLSQTKNLEELNISSTKLDGRFCSARLPKLSRLDCSNCKELTAYGISLTFPHMTALRVLDISNNCERLHMDQTFATSLPLTLRTLLCKGYTEKMATGLVNTLPQAFPKNEHNEPDLDCQTESEEDGRYITPDNEGDMEVVHDSDSENENDDDD